MTEDEAVHLPRFAISRRTLLGTGLGAGGAALMGLPARAQKPPPGTRKGRVTMAISQEPTTFNPLMPGIEVDEGIWLAVFDPLWAVLPDGSLSPRLATEVPSVENGGISADGRTWKIKLRSGVTWHDGAPFTADDVKFSLELIVSKGFRSRTRQGHELVRDIQITGPLEMTWRMERAYSPYVSLLATAFIVPKHILSQAADPNTAPFNNAPVGTGAFRWDERVPGDHITLAANEKYFRRRPVSGEGHLQIHPRSECLLHPVPHRRRGCGDRRRHPGQFLPGREEDPGGQSRPRAQRQHGSADAESWLARAGGQGGTPRAVRRDRQAIDHRHDLLRPPDADGIRHAAQSWAYNPNLPKQVYDIARSNKILDEAGWVRGSSGVRAKGGVPLEFAMSTTTGNALREQVQHSGVGVRRQLLEVRPLQARDGVIRHGISLHERRSARIVSVLIKYQEADKVCKAPGAPPTPPLPHAGQGKRGQEGHLAYLLRQGAGAVRLRMERLLADLGVTTAQFAVLTMLDAYPHASGGGRRAAGAADAADRPRHHG